MKKIVIIVASIITLTCFFAHSGNCQDSTKISKLLTDVSYGVPSSPAFELLPNKPSEVSHLTSGHDVAANISSFVDGGKLKSGAAFDIRPFAYAVHTLSDYQKNKVTQFLWRSVLSVGTASSSPKNSDVFIGIGVRIPLIDKGDPRADGEYIKELTDAYEKAYKQINTPPKNPNESAADHQKNVVDKFTEETAIKGKRDTFVINHWNALRWDVGIGASNRAASGFLKMDSLFRDRIGLWTAAGYGFGKKDQLTISANTSWIHAKADTNENSRSVIGAREKFFLTEGLSISGEYAKIFSKYADSKLNENWSHLAIVVEFKVPKLGGWFGLAYGGDSAHRTDAANKFSFNYAIYTDRLINKKQ